jgi:hypothetical protein
MKTLRLSGMVLLLSGALTLSVVVAHSAPPVKAPAVALLFDTNAIPLSVFTIPSTPGPARDPFFPSRIIQAESLKASTTTNARPVNAGASCLVLKGLSGAASNPLAIINGRTMGRGEDAEINTECGRILVHCVDITTNSAIVEVGGERRELRLRKDF